MNLNAFQASLYRFSYRYHLWVWRIGWLVAGSIVFCALAAIGQAFVRRPQYMLMWSSLAIFVVMTILRLVTLWHRARAIKAVERLADFMSRPYIDRLWWILWIGAIVGFAITFGSMGMWRNLSAWLRSQFSLTTTSGSWSASSRSYRSGARSGVVSSGNLRPTGPLESFWASLGVLQIFTLVWLVALVVWLLISSWHGLWFRYLAFWLSVGYGRLRRWLLSGWRGAVVLLGAVTVLVWTYSQLLGAHRPLKDFVSLEGGPLVLVVAAVITILYWAFEARRRIVILAFTDYTGDTNLKVCADGIAPQLLNQLVGLADLYRTFEESGSFTPGLTTSAKMPQAVNATVNVTDVGQTLQKIVSAESKVKLGMLELPIGALLGVLGRIVEGPRLTGSLHRAGDELVLLASLQGGASQGSWQVSQTDLEEGNGVAGTGAVAKMVEQMAYRIFTDLEQARLGSPRWRAVRHFSEGLRAVVHSLHSPQERLFKLHAAKRAFIEALADDEQFATCHYNLGIVYWRLDNRDAAQAAFLRAAAERPDMFEAHHALAWHTWATKGDPYDMARYSGLALGLQPRQARVWNLLALAGEGLKQPKHQVTRTYAIATALAWKQLCRAALQGQELAGYKTIASTCAHNLAAVVERPNSWDEATMRQAIYLQRTEAWLHMALARILTRRRNWLGAEKAILDALLVAETAVYWSELGYVRAVLGTLSRPARIGHAIGYPASIRAVFFNSAELRDLAKGDCEWALGVMADNEQDVDEILARTHSALRLLVTHPITPKEKTRVHQVWRMWALRHWIREKQPEREQDRRANQNYRALLRKLAKRYRAWRWEWGRGVVAIELASVAQYGTSKIRCRQCGTVLLSKYYPTQAQQRDLHKSSAHIYLARRQLYKAQQHAEHVAALEPTSYWEREELGPVYAALHDYDRAEAELIMVLGRSPKGFRSDQVKLLGEVLANRADNTHDLQKRRAALLHGITMLKPILELFDLEPGEGGSSFLLEARGWAHYWLARYHVELREYDQACHHLRIGCAIGFKPFEGRVMLGWLYFKLKAYDQAERALCDAETQFLQYDADLRSEKHVGYIGEESPRDIQRVRMLLYWALAWAERGVNLRRASLRIDDARQILGYGPWLQDRDCKDYDECWALHDVCHGWVRFRNAQLGLVTDPTQKTLLLDGATADLEQAVSRLASAHLYADAYLRLTQVYSERAKLDSANKDIWLAKAKEAAQHCKEADLRGEYTVEIDKHLAPPAQPKAKPDVLVQVNRKDIASATQSK